MTFLCSCLLRSVVFWQLSTRFFMKFRFFFFEKCFKLYLAWIIWILLLKTNFYDNYNWNNCKIKTMICIFMLNRKWELTSFSKFKAKFILISKLQMWVECLIPIPYVVNIVNQVFNEKPIQSVWHVNMFSLATENNSHSNDGHLHTEKIKSLWK